MDEFGLIKNYFAPLAHGFPGSLNLTDDAALIAPPPGFELVITKDALSAGVHFFGNEDAALIARKALRTNLSDLASMGATPMCYFLALMLPKNTKPEWVQRFATGLSEDQSAYGIKLAGGDTTATDGPLSLSITAIGSVPTGAALRRSRAKTGDRIYVSGTLGDSALGLALIKGLDSRLRGNDKEFLEQRYLVPQPRITLGEKLRGIAHGCMDISDGLVQDLEHLCHASHVGAIVHSDKLPLSTAAKSLPQALEAALSGGDDYELLFTIPEPKQSELEKISAELHLPLTRIGEIIAGDTVQVLDGNNAPVTLSCKGFQHF